MVGRSYHGRRDAVDAGPAIIHGVQLWGEFVQQRQVHVLSVSGHRNQQCYAAPRRGDGGALVRYVVVEFEVRRGLGVTHTLVALHARHDLKWRLRQHCYGGPTVVHLVYVLFGSWCLVPVAHLVNQGRLAVPGPGRSNHRRS